MELLVLNKLKYQHWWCVFFTLNNFDTDRFMLISRSSLLSGGGICGTFQEQPQYYDITMYSSMGQVFHYMMNVTSGAQPCMQVTCKVDLRAVNSPPKSQPSMVPPSARGHLMRLTCNQWILHTWVGLVRCLPMSTFPPAGQLAGVRGIRKIKGSLPLPGTYIPKGESYEVEKLLLRAVLLCLIESNAFRRLTTLREYLYDFTFSLLLCF